MEGLGGEALSFFLERWSCVRHARTRAEADSNLL